jgi:ribosomal protein S18 acetylase RimI-like enzyme
MESIAFRPLSASDAEAFAGLRQEVTAVSPLGMGLTLDEELTRPIEGFRQQLSAEQPSQVFGAFVGDRLVSSAGILWPTKFASGAHKAILWGVFTSPAFRRQSLARQLASRAVEHAFANGARRVYLGVYVPNPEAVSLYESLGFVSTGREPEVVKLGRQYFDIQYMSACRAAV